MTNEKSFEKAICKEWSAWDLIDTAVFQFYDAILTKEMEKLVKIEFVSCLTIDFDNMLAIGNNDVGEEVFSVPIKISIGD